MAGIDESRYFMDEVRDGFFIPGMTKKFWAVALKDYIELRKVCAKEGMEVYATWGTLLGAIRYGGYVPWDDDIDMMMDRADINRLLEIEDREELPGEYWISDYSYNRDDNMARAWIDSGAFVRTVEGCMENYGFPIVAAVDIFINDTLPDDPNEREAYRSIAQTYAKLSRQARALEQQKEEGTEGLDKEDIVDEEEFRRNIAKLGKILDIKVDPDEKTAAPLFVRLYQAMDEYCSRFEKGMGREMSMLAYYLEDNAFVFDKRLFSGYIDMPFEYGTMRVPVGYDGVLRVLWTRFMYPVLTGGSHGFPVYREFEKQLKGAVHIEYVTYHFDLAEYRSVIEQRMNGVSLKDTILDSCELFKSAHDFIIERCGTGAVDVTLADVLAQCQELAVSVGERIETYDIDGEEKVMLLESYCDRVYQLYLAVTEGGEIEVPEDLREYENRIAGFAESIRERKEIVLLCYRAEDWRSLHTIYEGLAEREDVLLTVIRVPYYKVGYDGSVNSDSMVIETTGYPDGIVFTEYDQYDFENRHPDVIVFQNPYDEYHCDVCIHPFYLAKNLHQYTDRLVLLPPFVTREPGTIAKLRTTMGMYLCNPGAMYADTILAQTEESRDTYIEILEEFIDKELSIGSGESEPDSEEGISTGKHKDIMDLSKKVIATGSPVYDWQSRKRVLLHDATDDVYYEKSGEITTPTIFDEVYDVPRAALEKLRNPEGGFKKILAFFVSGSMVFEHGKQAVEKMRQAFELLAEKEGILIWWYMDPNAREILKRYAKDAWVAFRELRDEFEKKAIGVLDETWNDTTIRGVADMIYADAGKLLNDIRESGRPALWETPGASLTEESGEHTAWTEDTILAVEGDWCLSTFVDLAMAYEVPKPADGNAERIIGELLK